jgi:pimeloyl-ACP methyl ester carboxylesterase
VLCRGNSLRVVIAPDVHGFGESRFAQPPTLEQGSLQAIARTALELTRLLGLRDLPLALVGHSMSGIALLSLRDGDYDPNTVRVAVNPILVSHDATIRPKIRRFARLARTLAGTPRLFRFVGRLAFQTDPTSRTLAPEVQAELLAENQTIDPPVLASVIEALAEAPLAIGRQEGVAIVACGDDPWMRNEAALLQAADDLGLERAQIHRMASGAHFPFLESAQHPEWTARNVDQLVRVIESMLVTANASTGSGRRNDGSSGTVTVPSQR